MGKKQRLVDVLKLTDTRKWAFFDRVNTNRDGALLETLSMKNKSDAASVIQLANLAAAELKKKNYDHVVALIRTIRRCFMDDEKVFRKLVKEGLDIVILTSTSELRQRAAQAGIHGQAPTLRLLLANISDMFEWEFFGSGSYQKFIEEMLAILTDLNDCDDSLFAEAASVMMAMCTTNISIVSECLAKFKTCSSLLATVLHNLPRSKSFFYEALVLEFVYRLYRHTKKAGEERTLSLIAEFISAFPAQIARALPQIPPKVFRDETRRVLNEFNAEVGVIKSYKLTKLECTSSCRKSLKIRLKPAGWIDLGGTMLEIEVKLLGGDDNLISTLKLPYKWIASVKPETSIRQINLTVSESVCLSDVVDGVNDPLLEISQKLKLCLSFEDQVDAQVADVLDQRMISLVSEDFVMIESETLTSKTVEPAEVECSDEDNTKTTPRLSKHDKPSNQLPQESFGVVKRKQKTQERTRHQTDKIDKASKSKQKTKADTTMIESKNNPKAPSSGHSDNGERSVHAFSEDQKCGRNRDGRDRAQVQVGRNTFVYDTGISTTPDRSSEIQKPGSEVIPDEEDQFNKEHGTTEDHSITQRQTFRSRQMHHKHQLQSLVEEILKTNDQFRRFNIGSLCDEVTTEVEKLLQQKREGQVGADTFASVSVAVQAHDAKRAEQESRQKRQRDEMTEVITTAAAAQAEASSCAAEILAGIQKSTDVETSVNFDRVQKKLRTQATNCATQAKAKLTAIEKSFNTDDLRVMQQMLQRI